MSKNRKAYIEKRKKDLELFKAGRDMLKEKGQWEQFHEVYDRVIATCEGEIKFMEERCKGK